MEPNDYAEIRKRWGLTQEQMALLMEVSGKLVISHYERGFRSPSAIIQKLYRMMDDLSEHDARLLMKWLEKFGVAGSTRKIEKAVKAKRLKNGTREKAKVPGGSKATVSDSVRAGSSYKGGKQ